MRQCVVCDKPVIPGLGYSESGIHFYHRKCRQYRDATREKLERIFYDGFTTGESNKTIYYNVEAAREAACNVKSLILPGDAFIARDAAGLRLITDQLSEGIISKTWEEKFVEFWAYDPPGDSRSVVLTPFYIPQLRHLTEASLQKRAGCWVNLVKSAVIRDLLDGDLPKRFAVGEPLPFNFQKNESLIWIFGGVNYYAEHKTVEYVGGHQGISIRVARGVYYRTGAFKGSRVENYDVRLTDRGLLGITNKHIYFYGGSQRFRISVNKIVSYEYFDDGIGIQRDAAGARPQRFVVGDGWFIHNLLANLANLS